MRDTCIGERLIELIREACALTEENITAESEIRSLSLDSLSFIQLVVNLEAEFNIEFPDEALDWNAYETVSDLVDKVKELTNAG
jgi:acyl carrier protein